MAFQKLKIASLILIAVTIIPLTACEKEPSSALFKHKIAGAIATDFTMPTIDGKKVTLSDYKGKLILLNFWASWCPPCRFEIPDFIKLQDKHKSKDFTFIGIAMENLDDAKAYSKQVGINYPIAYGYETSRTLSTAYGNSVGALPYSILIDRDQKIIATYPGLLTPTRLSKAIEKHL
ncbi:MAG: TlpA family protein disulfide reductase [Aquificaceae bacterium]|nr:MAG: TlpA family protein disulfide reductase [Aquificaceae bacterium]